MPLLKGKNAEKKLVNITGCIQHFYPLTETNDLQIFARVIKKAESDEEMAWQTHSHPNIEEYTYVISGKVTAIVGDEEYDMEEGDLLITPRGVPHKFIGGDADLLFFHSKHNVFGYTVQDKHPFTAYDRPTRKNKEEQDDLPEVGVYLEMDVLERERSDQKK